jgi:hypothetical protein
MLYLKNRTIVEADEILIPDTMGSVGSLNTGYMLIRLYDGTYHTLACADFACKYTEALPTSDLEGVDWF